MTIDEAALRLKAWAAENDALGFHAIDEFAEEPESLDEIAEVDQAASAESILKAKRLTIVAVDDEAQKIVVYTQRRLNKTEKEILHVEVGGEYKVDFRYRPLPKIRTLSAGGGAANTFELDGTRYTCGSSIFVANAVSAGTLGALMADADGQLYGLSNNHVSAACNYAKQMMPVVAPGPADARPGGFDPITIGYHHRALPFHLGDPDNIEVDENLDAAVFKIRDPALVSSMQRGFYDTPAAIGFPPAGSIVEKVGRTTGKTIGRYVGRVVGAQPIDVSAAQFGFRGTAYFSDFLLVENIGENTFAAPGDSGSLVVGKNPDGERISIGLVFAVHSGKSLTFVVPMSRIMRHLEMTLVSGHRG